MDDVMQPVTPETIASPEGSDWYTPQEVANLFRVDAKTVVRWDNMKKFEPYAVRVVRTPGNHRRYHKEDINRMFYELNPSLLTNHKTTETSVEEE